MVCTSCSAATVWLFLANAFAFDITKTRRALSAAACDAETAFAAWTGELFAVCAEMGLTSANKQVLSSRREMGNDAVIFIASFF